MSNTAEEIADLLLSIKAVTINIKEPFRYSSGILSPVYSDMRLLVSYPEQRRQVIDAWVKMINSMGKFDVIAATATAGIPHGAWISDKMDLPMVYVRSEAKGHGKKNQIEGLIKPGQKAVIVEDLISTAGSSLETRKALIGEKAVANDIAAIFNYTLKLSKQNISEAGANLQTLTTFPVVIERAIKQKLIKAEEQEVVLDWLNDAPGWGKKYGYE